MKGHSPIVSWPYATRHSTESCKNMTLWHDPASLSYQCPFSLLWPQMLFDLNKMFSLTLSYQTHMNWTVPRRVYTSFKGCGGKCCGSYSAIKIYCPCCQCCRQITYSERSQMPEETLRLLHHSGGSDSSFQSTHMSQQVLILDLKVRLNSFNKTFHATTIF